jgi:hypothetical protein
VPGVGTPPRFIVGRGPGICRKMSTRPQAPNVHVWSISSYRQCLTTVYRPQLSVYDAVATKKI